MPVPVTNANAQQRQITAASILARCRVKELKELGSLQARGWQDEHVDAHFAERRRRVTTAPAEALRGWYEGMIDVMQELDDTAAFIPTSEPLEFLDIGCAPGGFSTHILQTNPNAQGVGISLSESQGGHPLLLPSEYMSRYEYLEQDLLEYDLSPHGTSISTSTPKLARHSLPDAFLGRFQIVISDGHSLGNYQAPEGATDNLETPHAHRDSLLIAQLIIALAAVQPGGTIVLRLMHVEESPATQCLYLLDAISDTLVVYKPSTMHKNRASFYAVAKGVGGTEDSTALKERYIAGLRALWLELRTGGPTGGRRAMVESDLNFIVRPEEILDIKGYLDRLVELGRPVWAMQVEGLRILLRKKGCGGFQAFGRGL